MRGAAPASAGSFGYTGSAMQRMPWRGAVVDRSVRDYVTHMSSRRVTPPPVPSRFRPKRCTCMKAIPSSWQPVLNSTNALSASMTGGCTNWA